MIEKLFFDAIANNTHEELIHNIIFYQDKQSKLELFLCCIQECTKGVFIYIEHLRNTLISKIQLIAELDEDSLSIEEYIDNNMNQDHEDLDFLIKSTLFLYVINRKIGDSKCRESYDEIGNYYPIHTMTINNDINNIYFALAIGYDINEVCNEDTALMISCRTDNIELFELYLDHGANLIANNEAETHILNEIVEYEAIRCLSYYIQRFHRLNSINAIDAYSKNTPLHFACKNRNIDMVKILLEHGINKDYININGEKAIDIAIRNEDYEIASLLK